MPLKVLMLDLGETLVHEGVPFPHVPEALAAFNAMQAAEGEPLTVCLVSDFTMPTPPSSPEKIAAIFEEYLSVLAGFGLRDFFEPVEQRITLSAHAGALKPDRRIFEKAIERLGVSTSLTECLFITENAAHLAACADLGMTTLQFGSADGFTDWAEGPLLVASKLSAPSSANLEHALAVWLRAEHGMQLVNLQLSPQGDGARARVKMPWPLPANNPTDQPLHVEMPATLDLTFDGAGRVTALVPIAPGDEALREASHFVKTLEAHKQIAGEHEGLPPGATHRLITDGMGRKVLKRQRFSAI